MEPSLALTLGKAHYNDTLPQYRVVIQGIRLHYVHKRSMSPNAMPIIFCHGTFEIEKREWFAIMLGPHRPDFAAYF